MTAVAIQKKLVSYMQIADEKKIKAIYALLENNIQQDQRISIKQYNEELIEAENEFPKRDYISNSSMKKLVTKW